jgi:hypothetical protein
MIKATTWRRSEIYRVAEMFRKPSEYAGRRSGVGSYSQLPHRVLSYSEFCADSIRIVNNKK